MNKIRKRTIWIPIAAGVVLILLIFGALSLFTDIFPWNKDDVEEPTRTSSRRRNEDNDDADAATPGGAAFETPSATGNLSAPDQEISDDSFSENNAPEASPSGDAANTGFPAELVGHWAGSDGDTYISFIVDEDGSGSYSLQQGSYNESYGFEFVAGTRAFSVYVPENNTSGILSIDGFYKYSYGVLILDVRSTLADGWVLKRTIPCRRIADLREINAQTGMMNIDFMLAETREYPIDYTMPDFVLEDKYANFVVTEDRVYFDDDYTSIYIKLRLNTNKKDDDYDATVDMYLYNSQEDSRDIMRNSINMYTIPTLYPSYLDIGDFAIGDTDSISFIRGNVFVSVISSIGVEIVDLAEAIDLQILEVLNRSADRFNSK